MRDCSVEGAFPSEAFRFSGQSSLDAWTLRDVFNHFGWSGYDYFLSHEPVLCFQRIRELADEFPTWQHRAKTGKPPVDERDHLIAAMLKQFLHATFRQMESYLALLKDFFGLKKVPDANTLSEKNRTRRFFLLLRRFHAFILAKLPKRDAIIATDATGYSNTKASWSDTDYGLRATQDWIKSHSAIEVPQLLYLNPAENTHGRVHDSRRFETVWDQLPPNVHPIRSLADAAYAGEACLEVAERHGATPLHKYRKDARHVRFPETRFQKLVNFGTHWPNRFDELTAPRVFVETTFNCTKQRFGHQLRCRHPIARKNEIQAKQTAHNIRILLMRQEVHSP